MIHQCLYLSLWILCILSVHSQKAGEEQRVFKHPLTDMPSSAEDVKTAFYFPNHPDLKLPIGEVVIALCHFDFNKAPFYNISGVMGSINSPMDFRHHFQNYSYKPFGVLVKAGEEMTLKYSFQLHPDLDPVDYQLAITVFYENEKESFSNTFFNQTVELYLPTSEYDAETIFTVISSLLSTIAVALITVYACFPESKFVQNATKQIKKMIPTNMDGGANKRVKEESTPRKKTTNSNKGKKTSTKKQRRQETDEDDEDGGDENEAGDDE